MRGNNVNIITSMLLNSIIHYFVIAIERPSHTTNPIVFYLVYWTKLNLFSVGYIHGFVLGARVNVFIDLHF